MITRYQKFINPETADISSKAAGEQKARLRQIILKQFSLQGLAGKKFSQLPTKLRTIEKQDKSANQRIIRQYNEFHNF